MGSGEMTRPMSRVHRWVVSKIKEPVRAVFLDTPAGFELNADEISERACAYVAEYVGVPCSVVSFKSVERATARETDSALRKLRRANYMFAGPGSPTYVVRNWLGTPVFDLVARRVGEGAHLVLASAAAIAIGRYALPVYEVYKVGEDPHWVEGLDVLGSYGLDVAVVSHWNNREGGTFDTRYCYMGQPRFAVLEELLPDSTAVLGIDEYTACVVDLGANECTVMGAGQVTIRREGRERKFETGASFGLDELKSHSAVVRKGPGRSERRDSAEEVVARTRETLRQQMARAGEAVGRARDERSDLADMASRIYDLAQAVDEARDAGAEQGLTSEGRASLRELVIAWTGRLASSPGDEVAGIAPFVELLVSARSQLRAAKNWSASDQIRDGLSDLGIILEDGPEGTTWRRA
jgi:cyanophycinase-like exopeptidase